MESYVESGSGRAVGVGRAGRPDLSDGAYAERVAESASWGIGSVCRSLVRWDSLGASSKEEPVGAVSVTLRPPSRVIGKVFRASSQPLVAYERAWCLERWDEAWCEA